jgi:two-component system response regulator MtrA
VSAQVLIVEDNEDLAFGLRRTLEGEGYEVDVAADGPSGVRRALDRRPDLVILDLTLPGFDGYRALRTMREGGLQAPVLILTARGEEADKVYGFRLGADDYVTKPFGLSELIARVGALLRRARPAAAAAAASPEEYRFADVVVNPAARVVTRGGERVALTPKEFDLLLALVRRKGVVLSRVSLLREVWGHQADVLTRTVDIHVAELRRKLEEVPARPRYFVTVWKAGYRFDP